MLIPFKISRPILLLSERQKRVEGHLETAIDPKKGNYIKTSENDILAKKYFDRESENPGEDELVFVK